MAQALTYDELHTISPHLAAFVEGGLIAAFRGPAGLFAVYHPPPTPIDFGTRPIYVCTMQQRPIIVQLDLDLGSWDRTGALAVAEALADGKIRATASGATLLVSEEDADSV